MVSMTRAPPDVDRIGTDELRRLLIETLGKVADLTAENAALREEIARLKGLKGRPSIKPSGMEKASEAKPPGGGKKRRGRGRKQLGCVAIEDRVLTAEVPAGSRFKGYENFLIQDVVLRPVAIRFRRERWVTPDPVKIATEGALWGSIKAHGFLKDTVILSDDAGQFDVALHALCWVHAERLVHKLDAFTDLDYAAQQQARSLIWWFYRDLKAYRCDPTSRSTPTAQKTTAAVRSPGAKSAAAPAATPAATAETPSSASSRPAPSSASRSGTISAPGSAPWVPQSCPSSPTSSDCAAHKLDRPGLCPCYHVFYTR